MERLLHYQIMYIRKLFFGKTDLQQHSRDSTINHRLRNIAAIWNNEHREDSGLERITRLLLAVSQLFFFGTYLRQIFGFRSIARRDLVIDIFVLAKVLFPIIILYFGLASHPIIIGILIWFMLETMCYIPTLIFASDIFPAPRSYGRSILLLLFNYLEIVFGFAVFYASGPYMNQAFVHWFDPIYFSFVTSGTIGYGDFFPITTIGKVLVSIESVIFLIFVVLFLSFFTRKVESKGYFKGKHED
jgi:hypothetical protein